MLQEDISVSLLAKAIEDPIIFKQAELFVHNMLTTKVESFNNSNSFCAWQADIIWCAVLQNADGDVGWILEPFQKNISVVVCGKLISLHCTNDIEVVITLCMNICLDSKVKLWPEFNLLLPWFIYYVCYNYCVSSSLLCRSFIPFSYIYPSLVIISDDKTF